MDIITRIKNSYQKEITDYNDCNSKYRLSGLWSYTNVILNNLEERLLNFGTDEIGVGISLVNNNSGKEDTIKDIDLYLKMTERDYKTLEYPKSFGLNGFDFGQIFTIPSAPRLCNYAHRILELSNGNVVEIGGGFGGVPYHLFKMGFNKTYISFDIPNVSIISKYFLLKMFPDKKIMLYGEDKLSNFKKYDIVIMPHYMLPKLKKNSCDIVFNAHGLSEMGTEQINEYMKQINRICKKYFLHFNHDEQSFLEHANTYGVNKDNLLSLHNIQPIGWKKIGKWLEPLSESKIINYYEYLYEK